MSRNPCDYGGCRLLNDRPGLGTAVWSQIKVCERRLSLRRIGCTPALTVMQKSRCSCSMRLVALYVLYAFAYWLWCAPSTGWPAKRKAACRRIIESYSYDNEARIFFNFRSPDLLTGRQKFDPRVAHVHRNVVLVPDDGRLRVAGCTADHHRVAVLFHRLQRGILDDAWITSGNCTTVN